jgi:hypothetical protein
MPGKRNATIIKLAALMNQWISRSNTMPTFIKALELRQSSSGMTCEDQIAM